MAISVDITSAHPPVVVLCTDAMSSDALSFWLNESGITAVIAKSGYDARALLAEGAPRLLITDRVLPPWPGLDTLVALKQALTGLKIAVLEDGLPDNRALARSAGADIILTRPLRRAPVIEACRAAVIGGFACAS